MFNLKVNPNGRLSAIRNLSLLFTVDDSHVTIEAGRMTISRKTIIREWAPFLHQHRRDIYIGNGYVEFPTLETLTLNFSVWNLKKNEGLVVSILRSPRRHIKWFN